MREGVEKLHIACSIKGCFGANFIFRDYGGLLNNSRFLRELADDESLQVEDTASSVVYDDMAFEARIDGDYNKRHFISEVCTTRRCAQHDKKTIDRANVTTRRASPSLLHHHKINMGFSPF